LFKRSSFADGNTWGSAIDMGDAVQAGVNGDVFFNVGNSVSSFSQFIIAYNGPLPVEWLDFRAVKADAQTAALRWEVNQTADVVRFDVEKSADGVDFKTITSVNALAGAGEKTYTATDQQPFDGVNFYRIRQTDRDGQSSISAIRQLEFGQKTTEWIVYPNPVASDRILTIATSPDAEYRFILYDSAGKKVRDTALTGTAQITLPSLPAGLYAYAIYGAAKRVGGVIELK